MVRTAKLNPAQFDLYREAPPAPDLSWRPPRLEDLPEWPMDEPVSIDTETTGVGFLDEAVGVSFAFKDGSRWYLPFGHRDPVDNLPKEQVIAYLRDNAARHRGPIVGHNLIFDNDKLHHLGITFPKTRGFRDTLLIEKILYGMHDSYSLEACAKRAKIKGKDEALLAEGAARYGVAIGEEKAGLHKMAARFVGPYAEQDALLPLQILSGQLPQIKARGLGQIVELESQVLPVLLAMRLHGVRVNTAGLEALRPKVWSEVEMAAKTVSDRTKYWINPRELGQTEQCYRALYNEGGYEFKRTVDHFDEEDGHFIKGGNISIDKEWLEDQQTPTCDAILRGRKFLKLESTFIDGILAAQINARVPTDYNQMVTTSRLSSRNPNLQNIPSRDEDIAPAIKNCFLPEDDEYLFEPDYSGQELRLLIDEAYKMGLRGAALTVEDFRVDPHFDLFGLTARTYGLDRSNIKNGTYAQLYGGGVTRIAATNKCSTFEAQQIIDANRQSMPYIEGLSKLKESEGLAYGYVTSLLGRQIHLWRDPKTGLYFKSYTALNKFIQPSAATQTKLAMVNLFRAGILPLLQIHDSFLFSIVRGAAGVRRMRDILGIMVDAYPLSLPTVVGAKIGPLWGQVEKPYWETATGGWTQ